MRLKSLLYILLIVATAGFVAAEDPPPPAHAKIDDQNDGGGVTGPGCSENSTPPCDDEGDTLGGGGGVDPIPHCVYSQDLGPDALKRYMDCLVATLPQSVEDGAVIDGLDDVPTITFDEDLGDRPDSLCIFEASRDIQSTSLYLGGPRKQGKIRKFSDLSMGDGQIIVTVNNRIHTVDTSRWRDRDSMNRVIADHLEKHFRIRDEGDYWRIYGEYPLELGPLIPINRIGVKSTDTGVFWSGIALMPHDMTDGVDFCGGW